MLPMTAWCTLMIILWLQAWKAAAAAGAWKLAGVLGLLAFSGELLKATPQLVNAVLVESVNAPTPVLYWWTAMLGVVVLLRRADKPVSRR